LHLYIFEGGDVMQDITLFRFLVSSAVAIVAGLLLGKIQWHVFMPRLAVKNVELGCATFLNGFQVWKFEAEGAFTRIGYYIGHGLCYEASALLMLVWKDWKKTRYVFGRAYSAEEHGWVEHSWMEVKAYGIWWVFDCTWLYPVHPVPRLIQRLENKAFAVRKIPHDEFFSYKTATSMADMIQKPETSYLFHDLCCFRRSKELEGTKMMLMEYFDSTDFVPQGGRPNPLLIGIFKKGRPISQRIICEFLTRDSRKAPKKKSFRRARALEETMERYCDEAIRWQDTFGERPVLKLTSLKTFEILSVKEAEEKGLASSF
jgi:hypothetical protein